MGLLFDEFRIGDRFRTPGRTITEADIAAFAGLSGDYNPVHTDETFAAETGFGGRVAHGPMMIGIAFGLASRLDLIDGTVIALLSVTWSFGAPVRAGDTVAALIEVVEKRDTRHEDRGVLGLDFSVRNGREEVVQTGGSRLLMRRTRPPRTGWGRVSPEA
jgi:acyl dehydratase